MPAQEAFIVAWRELPRLRAPEAFPSWFRQVVVSRCHRLLRTRSKEPVSLDDSDAVAPPSSDPQAVLEARARRREVRRAIRMLPERDRMVVTLFYLDGHSYNDIAAFLEVPLSTVKKRLHDARRRLKEQMLTMVQDELESQRPSNDDEFQQRVQAMLQAALEGDASTVFRLVREDCRLAQGQDDPAHGHENVSPLHYAAEHGHVGVVVALLDGGADIDEVEVSHGLTPLGYAAVFPNQQRAMCEFLIARGARIDIFSACALGMTEQVIKLLNDDSSLVDARLSRCDWSMSPLHVAAWRGHSDVVELLMARGADAGAKDSHGKTPLERAEQEGHSEVAELLQRP